MGKRTCMIVFVGIAALAFLRVSSCGGGKDATEPDDYGKKAGGGTADEDVNWENQKLSAEDMEDFDEGKTDGGGGSKTAASGAGTGTSAAVDLGTGSGPGTLALTLKALGNDVVGEVKIITDDMNETVVETGTGKTSYTFSLKAGTYKVDATFHDAVDEPRLTLTGVKVPAGGKVDRVFSFPMAQVKFIPVKTGTGSIVTGYMMRLKAKGAEEWIKKTVKPGDEVFISPGNYEGELFKGKGKGEKKIGIPSIQINEGAKAQKRIDVSI